VSYASLAPDEEGVDYEPYKYTSYGRTMRLETRTNISHS
jgi:hypothetical protein